MSTDSNTSKLFMMQMALVIHNALSKIIGSWIFAQETKLYVFSYYIGAYCNLTSSLNFDPNIEQFDLQDCTPFQIWLNPPKVDVKYDEGPHETPILLSFTPVLLYVFHWYEQYYAQRR